MNEIKSDIIVEPLHLELVKNGEGWFIRRDNKVWGPNPYIPNYFGNKDELNEIYQVLGIIEEKQGEFNRWLLFLRLNLHEHLEGIEFERRYYRMMEELHVPPKDEPLLIECPYCGKNLSVTNAVDLCGVYMVECRNLKCRFCMAYLLNEERLKESIARNMNGRV